MKELKRKELQKPFKRILMLQVQNLFELYHKCITSIQKHLPRGVPKKRCFENMQQTYRRTPMWNTLCNYIEITLRHGCSPVNLLHIFRSSFPRYTSG